MRETCGVTGERPRVRWEIRQAYLELATPVEGELRREPIADADVACPRCGAREWLLIERRAGPDEPFTRWRALACANCGAADGWESTGRTRPGRAAVRWGEWDEETIPGLPDAPTVDDVCRLAPFRILSPKPSAELRSYSHMAGRLTGVTLAYGRVEVTTEVRPRILYSLPAHVEPQPERRARDRLERLVDNWRAALREPRSEPARALHVAAAGRHAKARAAATQAREAMIDVDGAPVPFTLVEHEGCWAAVADLDDTSVTIAAPDVPATEVALQTVLRD
jgi:hypothetical protein